MNGQSTVPCGATEVPKIPSPHPWTVGSSFACACASIQLCAPSSACTWHIPTPISTPLRSSLVLFLHRPESSATLPCLFALVLVVFPYTSPHSLSFLPFRLDPVAVLLLSSQFPTLFPSLVPSPHRPHLLRQASGVVVRPFRFSTALSARSSRSSRAVSSLCSCLADCRTSGGLANNKCPLTIEFEAPRDRHRDHDRQETL